MLAVVYCYCSATNGIFRSESKALIFSFRNGLLFEITYVRFFFKKNAENIKIDDYKTMRNTKPYTDFSTTKQALKMSIIFKKTTNPIIYFFMIVGFFSRLLLQILIFLKEGDFFSRCAK